MDLGEIPSLPARLVSAGMGVLRQARPPRPLSREHPEAAIPAMDAKWYRLATIDSVVVSMKDQTGAAFYQRDPDQFREPAGAAPSTCTSGSTGSGPTCRVATATRSPTITSPETWEETFTAVDVEDG